MIGTKRYIFILIFLKKISTKIIIIIELISLKFNFERLNLYFIELRDMFGQLKVRKLKYNEIKMIFKPKVYIGLNYKL